MFKVLLSAKKRNKAFKLAVYRKLKSAKIYYKRKINEIISKGMVGKEDA